MNSRSQGIPVLLRHPGVVTSTPASVTPHCPESQLREITIAVTGAWVKGNNQFLITAKDIARMCANFQKRKNEQIVVDYEHASEMPEIAKGGPIPAAGWIHGLKLRSDDASKLTALVEWTPQATRMIRNGEYRFFSPAIDWSAKDKETGSPQGATLTSGALTNHPFLEELPPIMLSDGQIVHKNQSNAPEYPQRERKQGAYAMKKLSIKPIPEGAEQSGDHAVMGEDSEMPLGFIPHASLCEYAAKHLGVNPDQKEDMERSDSNVDLETPHAIAACEQRQDSLLLLGEAVRKGKIDTARATELARMGKITLADYIQAQEAEKMIDAAISTGKILPRDRAFFFEDAIRRPSEFQEYIRNAPSAIRLGVKGLGSSEAMPLDEEIHLGVKHLMTETGLDYAKALKTFLSANPALGEQYRRKHCERIHADGTTN